MVDLRVTGKYARHPNGYHEAVMRSYYVWYHATEDSMGRLIIDRPGEWRLFTENREDAANNRATLVVMEDGGWILEGGGGFDVEEKKMGKTYFSLEIADSLFPANCDVRRRAIGVAEVRKRLVDAVICVHPSHKPIVDAAVRRYDLPIIVPERVPAGPLYSDDSIIVMSVRGLPRREGVAEYTQGEIEAAKFAFGEWEVQ